MKMNKKTSRVKKITRPNVIANEAWQSQRMAPLKARKSVSLLLVMILSLFLVAVPMAGIAEATAYYVRTDGKDTNDGLADDAAHAWLTIQHAVDTIVADDTINVAAGTYTITGAITVDEGVTITGNTGSPSSVVVTYSEANQTLDCFDMQANNITVQGIKVVNGRYGFNFAATDPDPTGCTISDCVIDHCYKGAINIDGGSGHTISDNTITSCLTSGTKRGVIHIFGCPDTTIDGNTLTDNGRTGLDYATMGIYVKFTYPSSSSERVEVINNNISGMLGINADIQVYDAPYTYIYNNTISNSEDKGIAIWGIDGNPAYTSTDNRVEVIWNTISSTYYPGLQACNAPYTYFYNNTLTHCNYCGGDGTGDFDYASIHIDIGSANCLIDSNTVSDGINGIQTWSNDVTIINNEIYDMGETYADTKLDGGNTYYNSAILYGDMYNENMPTSATISGNDIHDNYWGLFVNSDYTGTVIAEKNWWGDASGPKQANTNLSATGDEVSDNVDYNPWYTDAAMTTLSNTATLSNLTVDGTTISGFSSSTLTYNKVLPYGTTTVPTVAATPTDDPNATKVITQATNLTGTAAERTATVVVTAKDGITTKTYKVIFGSIKVTITKTGPTTANQGNNIIYTITYKNEGTFNATNVVITETYPSKVKFVSATPEPTEGNDKWTIGTLTPGQEGTITVTVHIK